MKTVTVAWGQTLIDIALQEYGCYEGVMLLQEDNKLVLGDILFPGQTILIRDEIPDLNGKNLAVLAAYKGAGEVKNGKYTGRKINRGFDLPADGERDYDDTDDDFDPIDYD